MLGLIQLDISAIDGAQAAINTIKLLFPNAIINGVLNFHFNKCVYSEESMATEFAWFQCPLD